MSVPDPILNSAARLSGQIASFIWKRPQLKPIREPIEAVFADASFRSFTQQALATLAEQRTLPHFFDEAFILQGPVQEQLAAYIVDGNDASVDELLRRYHAYVTDTSMARDAFAAYLGQLRETFANHPTYGNILLARDMQEMFAALLGFRDETRNSLAALSTQIETFLNQLRVQPEVKAALERISSNGHIFLSYSRADYGFAMRLKHDLEQRGHRVWIDTASIRGGEEWIDAITAGIAGCYALLTLVSEVSNQSKWVRREFLFAEQKRKPIIPIRVADCELPIYLLELNALPGFDSHYGTLMQRLDAQIPAPSSPRPVAAAPLSTDSDTPEASPTPDPREAYLDKLWMKHKIWLETYTPMAGVALLEVEQKRTGKRRVSAEIEPNLSLFTQAVQETFEREAQTRTETVDDIVKAVRKARQLLILGDPGAGKSTTMWKLAADYAQAAREREATPLPVLIKLGALPIDSSVEKALQTELGAALSLETLLAEKRIILLLDGLNELPAEKQDQKVQQIRRLVKQAQEDDLIAVVTCRELDYTTKLELGIPQRVTIDPLDPLRVHDFVCKHLPDDGEQLFWQLAGGEDVRDTWHKWQAVGASFELFWTAEDIPRENPNVYGSTSGQQDRYWREAVHGSRSMMKLARNPYMLFMMTEVFAQTGDLPPNRGQLFGLFVDFLLLTREQLSKSTAEALRDQLSVLAYTMQRDKLGTAVEKSVVLGFLSETAFYSASSANLLEGNDDIRFTHQLLQEYFAARKLDQERLNGTPATSTWQTANWWEPTGWEETAILMAGLYSDDCSPVVAWLRDAQPELAARCVLESGAGIDEATLTTLQNEWLPRLTDIDTYPRPQDRAGFGRGLGLLKLDKRKGVSIGADGLPDIDWVEIPAGKFLYGDDNKDDYPDFAKPADRQELELNTFYISRYPITYAQFQAFLDADDGINSTEYDWFEGLAADADDRQMAEQRFKYANHPRETVNWYQAMAFCRWVSWRLVRAPYTEPLHNASFDMMNPFTWPVRLLTEQEWEKAARGMQGLIYPYGNEFDAAKGNTRAGNNIGQTSAVGMYPQGASPYGVLDMSGNVFDWCLTAYEDGDNQNIRSKARRVLRGGSWNFNHPLSYARAASRSYSLPLFRDVNHGFRVVRPAPIS